ncbi:histidine kinase [Rhodanobacter sp. T12-5]|uniref:sensor histidine kinase n=1 Tax=Rhodanobacter sp. T12-5 TaxID=2024611 RepID=UPI0011EBF7F9|nr:histidine kinase [Rhodanobacter sp. T12-5]KAA0072212.1 sensor histidine kinase [Rhodanobacter sp. T12-5]
MNMLPRPPSTDVRADYGATFPQKSMAALWALWAVFWLLMIGVSIEDQLRNPLTRWWEPVLTEGSSALVSTGWMWLAVRVRERHVPYLDKPLVWFASYLRWLPLIFVTWITAVYTIRHGVYAAVGRTYEHPGWGFVSVYESIKLTIFAGLWLGILFGIDSYGQWQLQRHRLLQTQKALAEAQLAQLQGQLRPHFLFNALNTVSALMHTDVARADRLVAALGDLLRISLRSIEHEMTPLAEELRTLELYADIMHERFRDRVTLSWQTDPTLLDIPVPALLLQPLLENVFKHGVEPTVMPVRIHISVLRESDSLAIAVSNSSSMLAPEHRDGVGFRNCRERLGIIYGDAASLRVRNEDDGVAARVLIPLADTVQ